MGKIKWSKIVWWIARIYGTVILVIPLMSLVQTEFGTKNFVHDWRNYVLYSGLIIGLFSAYRWPLIGGIIATLGIFISGFIHPIIVPVGILYILSWILKIKEKESIN